MAGLADVILSTNPVSGLQTGLQSGEQLGSSYGNAYARAIQERAQKQQMANQAAMAPSQLQINQANAKIEQQKAMDQGAIDKANLDKLKGIGSAGSNFAVTTNPITGQFKMYDKSTGRYVTPGQESTIAGSVQPISGQQQSGLSQQPVTLSGALPMAPSIPSAATGETPSSATAQQLVEPSLRQRYSPLELTYVDPKTGETKTYTSPTTTAVGQAQVREMALSGINDMSKHIVNSMAPYQGGYGRGQAELQKDIISYDLESDPTKKAALAKKLTDFASIANSKNEVSGLLARAAIGKAPGEAALAQQAKQVFNQTPSVPENFPRNLLPVANKKMFDFTKNLGKSETEGLAKATNPNYPKTVQKPYSDSGSGKILMVSATGQKGYIPVSQLKDALKQGYKRG